MRIIISHPDITNNPRTFIDNTVGAHAGDYGIYVRNSTGFNIGDFVLLGEYGDEDAEIVRITAKSVRHLTTTSLLFNHEQGTPVTLIQYDKFRVYKSINGINGDYNLVTTKSLNVDDYYNYYEEYNVSLTWYYKFSYYNSYTGIESSLSSPIPASGFAFESLNYIQNRILVLFGDIREEKIKKEYITDWINEYYENLQIKIAGGRTGRFAVSTDITVNNSKVINLSTYNILQIFLVEFSENGVDFDDVIMPISFTDRFSNVDLSRNVYAYFKLDESGNMYLDREISGTIRIWYWTAPTRLSDETDRLILPFAFTTEAFVNYGLARAYEKDRKFDEAKYFRSLVDKYEREVLPYIKNKIRYSKYYMTLYL
ncbi:MAG: hypothetical protein QXX45_03310 [Candidatus Aenigmatarchaeota archaeon]